MNDIKVFEMETDTDGTTHMLSASRLALVCGTNQEVKLGLRPASRYAVQLTYIPDGYRLATDEDKLGDKPDGARFLRNGDWEHVVMSTARDWCPENVYIIPVQEPMVTVTVRGRTAQITPEQARSIGLID